MTGTGIGNAFDLNAPKPLFAGTGKFVGGRSIPWANKSEAFAGVATTDRSEIGQLIAIGTLPNSWAYYQFERDASYPTGGEDSSGWNLVQMETGGAWGDLTGDIEDQTDLQALFDDKAAIPTEQTLTDAATVVWDYELGAYAKVTLGGNRTLSLTNATAPASGILEVIQDGTGSRTLTLPGNVPSALGFSSGAGETDILGFTKTASGVFWDITNYGTVLSLTQLNPPVLTAGTPTADGCPFTFTDTNTSPAESSGLIQIAAGADTGFTSILATRTPAANATSEAAGTGLTATNNYRARMKWVGDGITTSDSAWSTAVTFTTAASGNPELFLDPGFDAGFGAPNWEIHVGAPVMSGSQVTIVTGEMIKQTTPVLTMGVEYEIRVNALSGTYPTDYLADASGTLNSLWSDGLTGTFGSDIPLNVTRKFTPVSTAAIGLILISATALTLTDAHLSIA